jgi:acetyltransferase-like isoleucine patch superfamily enzyme
VSRSIPPIVLFGSRGNALMLRDLMRRPQTLEPLYNVVAYIDDFRGNAGLAIDGAPIVSFARWQREFLDVPCLITVGDPQARRSIGARLREAGALLPAVYDREGLGEVTVEEGAFVASGQRFDAGAHVGAFAIVYPFVCVSADARIGDYVTLCPRAQLIGRVHVEDDVFVGAGAQIIGDAAAVRIGRGARVSAGTIVRASLADGRRAYGDPTREVDGMHVVR